MASASDGRSSNQNKQLGRRVEEYRAEQRGGEVVPEAWFDVEGPNGELVEVKSTNVRLADGRRGRYQLERENHENLVDHGGVYDFVLRDDPKTADEIVGKPASEVEELRREHELKWPDGGKLKLPWSYLHDVDDVEP